MTPGLETKWDYSGRKGKDEQKKKTEYGPMPNVMAALPNIGGGLCSTPQNWTDDHY